MEVPYKVLQCAAFTEAAPPVFVCRVDPPAGVLVDKPDASALIKFKPADGRIAFALQPVGIVTEEATAMRSDDAENLIADLDALRFGGFFHSPPSTGSH